MTCTPDNPASACSVHASQALADAVVEQLMSRNGAWSDLEALYAVGACQPSAGDTSLSVLVDGEEGTVGFVEDCHGSIWLTTWARGESAGCARRLDPQEQVADLVRACTQVLSGPVPRNDRADIKP